MKRILILAAMLASSGAGLLAEEVVYVNAASGSALNTNPSNCGVVSSTTYWSYSGSVGTSDPCSRTQSAYKTINLAPQVGLTFSVTPQTTNDGATYAIYATIPNVSSASATISWDVSCTGGTLGLNPVMTNSNGRTIAFQHAINSTNAWTLIGWVTNNPGVTQPTISFFWMGDGTYGTVDTSRMYMDAFKFDQVLPCGATPAVGVTGPLAANLTNVVVTGVLSTATNVTVYQNGTKIGKITTGIVAGNNTVPVTGLVKGGQVVATQTIGGNEGCVSPGGLSVGGGANPRVRFAISVREDTTLTGPVGADGGARSGTRIFFLGTSSDAGGPPGTDAPVLTPSTNWQTLTLTPNVSHEIAWAPVTTNDVISGAFGIFESLDIALDDTTDTGPFRMYLDDMMSGTTVISDWESAATGAAYGFNAPSFSSTTSGNILAAPNEAVVTNEVAASGSKSLRVQFQFSDNTTNRWVRLTTATPAGGKANPEVDLTKPVSIKVFLPPVGWVPPPPAPVQGKITLTNQTATAVTLVWNGGTLQSAPALLNTNTAWADVTGANSPYTVTTSSGSKFYRLRY